MVEVEMNGTTPSVRDELITEIENSFGLLHKAAANFDNRYISRVFRDLGPLRRKVAKNGDALATVIDRLYPHNSASRAYLLEATGKADESMDEETKSAVKPEVDLYIHLLVQVYLLDNNRLDELDKFNDKVVYLLESYNRRSLDFIQAKIWFYISRTKELIDDLHSIRPALLSALRSATLRHDTETAASTITLLLRNYSLCHEVNQAMNLVEKTEFPENAGSSLVARYYYYLARINAIQLDYSSASEYVIAATRKAPQTQSAVGFLQAATKLSIIIELLMGDIPELQLFRKQSDSLEPYFMLTKAVRLGDLKLFEDVLKKYEQAFKKDDNFTLVSRLRQNVIKTGIRSISLSYSKISLKDICIKLLLDSEESAEYIVAKAIRDGVIEASINHEHGYMKSKELLDVYSTKMPQDDFDQRIKFCLSLHNDSVKSMRYPSADNRSDINKHNLAAKEDEMDLLKAIEEGDLDDFMD
ncbi:putative 26S proteasome regulatory subunit rpn3 [Meyerozyma sp. JA9]|nr:putative 26S proteasome regulatory subunit rpn3 [Meyerozyma sp. JA9]